MVRNSCSFLPSVLFDYHFIHKLVPFLLFLTYLVEFSPLNKVENEQTQAEFGSDINLHKIAILNLEKNEMMLGAFGPWLTEVKKIIIK